MKLARISIDGDPHLARRDGDALVPVLAEKAGMGVGPWIEKPTDDVASWNAIAEPVHVDSARFLPAVREPSKILAIGLNYHDHATESAIDPPTVPLMFAKTPNTLLATGETIRCPSDLTLEADYEAELAVVIGKPATRVSEEAALDHVYGYSLANDVSARDAQFSDVQWVRGKSFDTFCPIGPYLTPTTDISDLNSLRITARLNGKVMQDATFSSMVFSAASLVSYLSRCMTLYPGDVILTGTPGGVGFAQDPPVYLSHGDTVEIEVGDLGVLSNDVSTAPVLALPCHRDLRGSGSPTQKTVTPRAGALNPPTV